MLIKDLTLAEHFNKKNKKA